MKLISTPSGPPPAGHYSQAVVHGGVVYVAGMLGRAPNAGATDDPGGAGPQTRQALANVAAVLEASGSSLTRVLSMTVYVSEMELWGEVNDAYAAAMGEHKPARAIVPVKAFKGPYVVEIVATAAVDG